jgi:hypothetical protein
VSASFKAQVEDPCPSCGTSCSVDLHKACLHPKKLPTPRCITGSLAGLPPSLTPSCSHLAVGQRLRHPSSLCQQVGVNQLVGQQGR